MFSNFVTLLASSISSGTINKIVKPLLEICDAILPIMIEVVGAIGLLYCIVLGVKYARADDPQEHEKAKQGLKNAIIGFVLIFVLLIACKTATTFLGNWVETYTYEVIAK